jgi:hypothetical protein
MQVVHNYCCVDVLAITVRSTPSRSKEPRRHPNSAQRATGATGEGILGVYLTPPLDTHTEAA